MTGKISDNQSHRYFFGGLLSGFYISEMTNQSMSARIMRVPQEGLRGNRVPTTGSFFYAWSYMFYETIRPRADYFLTFSFFYDFNKILIKHPKQYNW